MEVQRLGMNIDKGALSKPPQCHDPTCPYLGFNPGRRCGLYSARGPDILSFVPSPKYQDVTASFHTVSNSLLMNLTNVWRFRLQATENVS
jgi:hypothetical protein